MPRPPVLAPLLIILGAALLILTAGAEIAEATRAWLKGRADLPKELILHALIAGAALLLAAAVLMTRRSVRQTVAAEAALRESEERLRLVANNVPALISYVDRDQRYRFSNRTYDDWFGIAHEEMLGRTLAEIFGEESYARMRGEIERCLGGAAVEFELSIADGERRRTLQVACVPHLASDGEVHGFYLLANDVTALKQAQEDLRFAAVQLQHDARRLEFLAHHDTLTGLPNRAMFTDRAREAISFSSSSPTSWPRPSFTCLKLSMSRNRNAAVLSCRRACATASRARSVNMARLGRPVSVSWCARNSRRRASCCSWIAAKRRSSCACLSAVTSFASR